MINFLGNYAKEFRQHNSFEGANIEIYFKRNSISTNKITVIMLSNYSYIYARNLGRQIFHFRDPLKIQDSKIVPSYFNETKKTITSKFFISKLTSISK